MSVYKNFVKNNSLVLGGQLLVQARSLIIIPVLIRAAGVEIYGAYVLLISLLGLAFGLSPLGAGFKFKRFLPSTSGAGAVRALFYPQFWFQISVVALLAAALVLLETPLKGNFFRDGGGFSIWLVPIFLLIYTVYSQVTDYFRYSGRMSYFTFATTFLPYASLGLMLAFYFRSGRLDVNKLLAAECLAMSLVTVPLLAVLLKEIGLSTAFYTAADLKSDIKLGLPLLLAYVVDFVLSAGDRYVIALYLSAGAVGCYVPAYSLGTMIVLLPKVSGVVLPQLLSKAVDAGQPEKAGVMVGYMLKGYLMAAVPFVAGAALLSRPLLALLANADVAQQAWLVTPIVSLATLFYGMNIILANIFFVRMKTAELLKWNLASAALNMALNLFLIWIFKSILVAAFTTLVSYALIFVPMFRKSRELLPFPVDFAGLGRIVIASAVMVTALLLIPGVTSGAMPAGRLAAAIGAGAAVYAAALATSGFFSRKEIDFVRSLGVA